MEKLKKYKGITLIALVVTILVLLIIAGVALNLALGENGLFNQTKLAVEKYKDAQNKEEEQLQIATNAMLGDNSGRGDGEVTYAMYQSLVDEINKLKQSSQGAMAVPTGTVISLMGNTAQSGYLICDGGEYEISDYQNLANYFEEQFGSKQYFGGTGTKFKLPDLRGEFLRGTGINSHENQGNGANVGAHQDGTIHQDIKGYVNNDGSSYFEGTVIGGSHNKDYTIVNESGRVFVATINDSIAGRNSDFTSRPTNTSVLYCIKY